MTLYSPYWPYDCQYSLCESCLVDLMGLVLLVSSIASASYNSSFPLSREYSVLQLEGPNGNLQFRLHSYYMYFYEDFIFILLQGDHLAISRIPVM